VVLVRLYYKPSCPKCDELMEFLFRLSAEIGFDFEPVLVDTSFEVFYTKDPASKTYSGDWISSFGSEKQKKLYKEAKPIFDLIEGSTVTPVIEITWFNGLMERSVFIKGYSEEGRKKALTNIAEMILNLIQVERRASSPLRFRR